MGAIGCIRTGGAQSNAKRVMNGLAGQYLAMYDHCKKNMKLVGMTVVVREDHVRGMDAKKRCSGIHVMHTRKWIAHIHTTAPEKDKTSA